MKIFEENYINQRKSHVYIFQNLQQVPNGLFPKKSQDWFLPVIYHHLDLKESAAVISLTNSGLKSAPAPLFSTGAPPSLLYISRSLSPGLPAPLLWSPPSRKDNYLSVVNLSMVTTFSYSQKSLFLRHLGQYLHHTTFPAWPKTPKPTEFWIKFLIPIFSPWF